MTMTATLLTPATITRLEKAAVDNGLDLELPHHGDWVGFASTQASGRGRRGRDVQRRALTPGHVPGEWPSRDRP